MNHSRPPCGSDTERLELGSQKSEFHINLNVYLNMINRIQVTHLQPLTPESQRRYI